MDRLLTVTGIEGLYFCFDPKSMENILSAEQIDRKLRAAFNKSQGQADLEQLQLYKEYPDKVPSIPGLPYRNAEQTKADAINLAEMSFNE